MIICIYICYTKYTHYILYRYDKMHVCVRVCVPKTSINRGYWSNFN